MRLQTDAEIFLNGERVAGLERVNEAWVCMNENQGTAAKKLPQVLRIVTGALSHCLQNAMASGGCVW